MSLKKMDNNILDYVVSNDFIYTYFYNEKIVKCALVSYKPQNSINNRATFFQVNKNSQNTYKQT